MVLNRRIPDRVATFPTTSAALEFAERRHAAQRRKADGVPFIEHPREVAALLYHSGAPDHVIAAGVLHDVIEKTDSDAAELRERFGGRVARLVLAVSEDESIAGYKKRKAALRDQARAAGEEALMVFAADKVSKTRELTGEVSRKRHSDRHGWSASRRRRLDHYRRSLALLEEHMGHSPLVRVLRSELRQLAAQAPGATLMQAR